VVGHVAAAAAVAVAAVVAVVVVAAAVVAFVVERVEVGVAVEIVDERQVVEFLYSKQNVFLDVDMYCWIFEGLGGVVELVMVDDPCSLVVDDSHPVDGA
jgi:hypothetical protein